MITCRENVSPHPRLEHLGLQESSGNLHDSCHPLPDDEEDDDCDDDDDHHHRYDNHVVIFMAVLSPS